MNSTIRHAARALLIAVALAGCSAASEEIVEDAQVAIIRDPREVRGKLEHVIVDRPLGASLPTVEQVHTFPNGGVQVSYVRVALTSPCNHEGLRVRVYGSPDPGANAPPRELSLAPENDALDAKGAPGSDGVVDGKPFFLPTLSNAWKESPGEQDLKDLKDEVVYYSFEGSKAPYVTKIAASADVVKSPLCYLNVSVVTVPRLSSVGACAEYWERRVERVPGSRTPRATDVFRLASFAEGPDARVQAQAWLDAQRSPGAIVQTIVHDGQCRALARSAVEFKCGDVPQAHPWCRIAGGAAEKQFQSWCQARSSAFEDVSRVSTSANVPDQNVVERQFEFGFCN